MKLENTLENKEKFIALYWGQEVLYVPNLIYTGNPPEPSHEEWGDAVVNEHWLPKIARSTLPLFLTSLSQITDEDLIELTNIPEGWEVFKIYNTTRDGYSAVKIRKLYSDGELKFNDDGYKYDIKTLPVNLSNTVDKLRSKGYAVQWMGLSVENLIEYGWIKLKT